MFDLCLSFSSTTYETMGGYYAILEIWCTGTSVWIFYVSLAGFCTCFFLGGGEKMDSDILFLWGGGVWNVTTGMWNCFGVFWCFMSLCLVDYDGWCLTSMVGVCDFCLIFWFVWWGVWLVWFIILCVWMIEGTLERSEWRGMMWMFDWWIGQWFRFLKRWVERSVFFLGGMSGWWEEVSLI